MIRQGTRRFLLLAAWLWLSCLPSAFARQALPSLPDPEWSNPADYASTTSPLKNRVGGAAAWSSGRFSNYDPESPEIATGSNGCEYESASGRRKWLNQDPIGELGGVNLYRFVGNDPINGLDPLGLEGNPVSSTLPGLTGAWNADPYGPGGSFYRPGAFCKPRGPSCMEECLNSDPLLPFALGLTPLGLLNLKNPVTELRPGASPFTSLDRRLGWPLGKGGASVERVPGIVKPVGPLGTTVAVGTAFGVGYTAGAILRCSIECAGKR